MTSRRNSTPPYTPARSSPLIFSGEDFGNIVYNMIEVKLLSASPEDSQEDFQCHPKLADELQERIDSGLLIPEPPPPPFLD